MDVRKLKVLSLAVAEILLFGLPVMGSVLPADRTPPGGWKPGIPGGIPTVQTLFCNVMTSIPGTNVLAVGDGVADDTGAIQAALSACTPSQVVYLPAGTFRITSALRLKSDIVLRGAGRGSTRLVLDSSNAWTAVSANGGMPYGVCGVPDSIVAGGNTVTLSDACGAYDVAQFKPGQLMGIAQLNDPSLVDLNDGCNWCGFGNGSQAMSQMMMITNVTGRTLAMDRPFFWKFANGVTAYQINNVTRRAGIEEITIDTAKQTSGAGGTIELQGTVECWVKGVEIEHSTRSSVWMRFSLRNEVRECYIHDPQFTTSGQGYGVHIFGPNSDILVENNILRGCRHSLVLEGGGSGCVFGYNYSIAANSTESPGFVYNDIITHAAHPFYNLYEGNSAHKWGEDHIHGSASHNVAYRNEFNAGVGDTNYRYTHAYWPVALDASNCFMSVVGNVLGAAGVTTNYIASNTTNEFVIYRFGFASEGALAVIDPNVQQRTYLHGNYDYATRTVIWNPTNNDQTLPDSLYLSAKPAWWGTNRWPPIDPRLTPAVAPIPAVTRYGSSLGKPKLTPPGGVRVVQ